MKRVALRDAGGIEMSDLPFPANAAYLRVAEVASLLRVDVKTIRRWIVAGELPATQPGRDWRIARSDLRAFLHSRGERVIANVL